MIMTPSPGDRGTLGGNGTQSILIPVERPEDNIAFIIMPFSEEFKELHHAICQASLKAGLTPLRTDTAERYQDFAQAVVNHIRQARVIVAVCTPELNGALGTAAEPGTKIGKNKAASARPSADVPNPNVMYELGMSHAIGKATVILTTDPNKLPSDIRTKIAVRYDQKSIDDDLILEICAAMNLAKDRVRNGLTDQSHTDIKVVVGPPPAWRDILRILRFAKQVHHDFQELHLGHLDGLTFQCSTLYGGTIGQRDLGHSRHMFATGWNMYDHAWKRALDSLTQNFFGPHVTPQLTEVIDSLKGHHVSDQTTIIESCHQFYTEIYRTVSNFKRLHTEELLNVTQNNLPAALYKPETVAQLAPCLELISSEAKTLVIYADTLIVNLINLMEAVDK